MDPAMRRLHRGFPLSLCLIARLERYPRGSRVACKKASEREREREKASRALALSDPTFHDRLMWDRAAIKHGEEVTASFIARVMDH